MEDNFYDETMDMPTPCEHCHTIFDLNDGYGSEKWHPYITICADCHDEEEKEIEEDDYYDTLNEELCNALYGIEEKKGAWERLDKDNQALIIQLVRPMLIRFYTETCNKTINNEYAENIVDNYLS